MLENMKVDIPNKLNGARLDLALRDIDLGLSRRKIRKIIDLGGVYINRKRVRIASKQVWSGDLVELSYEKDHLKPVAVEALARPLETHEIVYISNELIALNKRPGLPSQATREQSIFHAGKILQDYLGEPKLPILVHRLDMDTSGLLLFARNAAVATRLTEHFRERTIKKKYLALCYGVPSEQNFRVDNHLSAIDKRTGEVTLVHAGGKRAITDFVVLAVNKKLDMSLLGCFPSTGRSHQIRVHLALKSLPILGDKRYGRIPVAALASLSGISLDHHLLHAHSLEIPGFGEGTNSLHITADLPALFRKCCEFFEFKL